MDNPISSGCKFILLHSEGSGKVIFGDDNKSFETEVYDFTEQEVVIIPREVPYLWRENGKQSVSMPGRECLER